MKKAAIIIVFMSVLGCTTAGKSKTFDSIERIVFASGIDAGGHLKTEDTFLQNLSPFDRSARLKTGREVDHAEYLDYIAAQTLDWTAEEKEKINNAMVLVNLAFSQYSLSFPEELIFIKTTGLEEGNAAYCRGNNIIVLPASYINVPMDRLCNLLIHELFHIYSRNNSVTKDALYEILSFRKCGELQLPEEIFRWKITNPDAASNNYFFSSTINGSDYALMPILLASSNYNEEKGGEFFDYLGLYFIAITENNDAAVPLIRNGSYVLFAPDQVPDYGRLIGRNTTYIIHPEEVLADNFLFMVNNRKNLPNMEIIEEMRSILK